MPQQKRQPRKIIPPFIARHKILSTLLVLAVVTIAGLQIWQVRETRKIEAEKAAFAQAERDIDQLSSDIIAKVGQPLRLDRDKYCTRPSSKFDEGPLSCVVTSKIYYDVENPINADQTVEQSEGAISRMWRLIDTTKSNNMSGGKYTELVRPSHNPRLDYQQVMSNWSAVQGVFCSTSYAYYDAQTPPYSNYLRGETGTRNLAIDLDCSAPAKIQHYPMDS